MNLVRPIRIHVRVPRIVAVATIRGRHLGVCKTFVVAAAATVYQELTPRPGTFCISGPKNFSRLNPLQRMI